MKSKKEIKTEVKPTDAETAKLKGPVNTVMQTAYKAHLRSGEVVQGKLETDYTFHNKNFITTYNESGRKTKDQQFGEDGIRVHVFNEKGLMIKLDSMHKNSLADSYVSFTYNEKGGILESVALTSEGKMLYRVVNTYRDDFKPLGHVQYAADNERIIAKSEDVYDDRGNHLSKTNYGLTESTKYKDLEVTTRYLNKYNDLNQRIEYIHEYVSKALTDNYQRFTYKYNDYGDVIETNIYHKDGSLKDTYYSKHEYDSDGKKIVPKHVPFNPDALKEGETEEVETDAHGNWIKKTTYYDKIPVNIYYREISYFGESPKAPESFIHPATLTTDIEKAPDLPKELTKEEAQWLSETTSGTGDNFAVVRYYTLLYKEAPSLLAYTGPFIEAFALMSELKKNMDAQEVHSYSTVWNNGGERIVRYTLSFPRTKYLLQTSTISGQDDDEFIVPENIKKHSFYLNHSGNVYLSQIHVLRPSEASGSRDPEFEEELDDYIRKCTLKKKPDKPVINMIEVTQQGFTMKEHAVDDNFEIKDLDVNYGSGFEKFHNDLMQRFASSTKGLVLFHGHPGTGKTYYIRHLLKKMVSKRKVVIYMPPNMVDHLTDPSFMTFLSGAVQDWSDDGNFCVLLIEDAEPLLAKRQEGVRIQGVTNLLNMTDGLLNDMLNLQIICTFNVDLRKLDSALLRPGRLIARKEFKPLSELDANLLAQRLGIKHHFTKPASLGEIYAMRKNQNTLIHDVEPDRNASRPIDDF